MLLLLINYNRLAKTININEMIEYRRQAITNTVSLIKDNILARSIMYAFFQGNRLAKTINIIATFIRYDSVAM